jgi:hypothetical protein
LQIDSPGFTGIGTELKQRAAFVAAPLKSRDRQTRTGRTMFSAKIERRWV